MIGWANYLVLTPAGDTQRHLVPVDDVVDHVLWEHCQCCPEEDAETPDYWRHSAHDDRESYENGRPLH